MNKSKPTLQPSAMEASESIVMIFCPFTSEEQGVLNSSRKLVGLDCISPWHSFYSL